MTRPRMMVTMALEGLADHAVAQRILQHCRLEAAHVYGKQGKDFILKRISGWNQAAHREPWFVLVDMDRDGDCAPPLRIKWLRKLAPKMVFRIAVREVEAWLIADRERLAVFLGLDVKRITLLPEKLADPKAELVRLAGLSPESAIRKDMVPRIGSGRPIGPAYNSRMMEFARNHWRPEVAARRSDSLKRCIARLRKLNKS